MAPRVFVCRCAKCQTPSKRRTDGWTDAANIIAASVRLSVRLLDGVWHSECTVLDVSTVIIARLFIICDRSEEKKLKVNLFLL